jgi:hypothetical protein
MFKRIIIALCMLAVLSTPAVAGVNLNLNIDVAPPPPQVEVVPAPRPGYVWAAGRWVPVHRGYYWVPDRWVEYRGPRGPRWYFEPGHWEREHWHRRY